MNAEPTLDAPLCSRLRVDLKHEAISANVVTITISQKKPDVRLYFASSGALVEIHGAIMSLNK